MPSPYTPLLGAPQAGNLDFQGFEARRLRLHDLGANSMSHASNWNGTPKDGAIGYSSDAGDKRPYFYDTATGTDIPWLRGAYQETIAAQWNFTIATGTSPFAVTSTTVVTNLNADRTDGYHAAETATASTLAARDSNGRLTAADPSGSANGELVTYGFMFSFMAGVRDPKAAVLAIYPTVLPAFTFNSGGNTITADANGAINPVDGQTLAVNDRIGIVFETGATKPYNGIFIVTQVGSAGTPFILSRAVDANQDAEVTNGMQFWVTTGTTYGSSGWLLTTPDPITLNTTDLNFVQNNGATGITAGNGIVKAGNTIHAIQSSAYTQWGVVYAPTTSTLALTAAGTAGYYFAGAGGSAPVWTAPAALTRVDDTNVTLTLGGSPSVALLAAASLTLGWTGTLSVARGGSGVATYSAGVVIAPGGTTALTTVTGTNGRIPFWSSNSFAEDADLSFAGDTLTATKVLAPTSVSSPSLISTAGITMTPASGSSLTVSLATTGDFIVNTDHFYVDTSSGNVGMGLAAPLDKLHIRNDSTTRPQLRVDVSSSASTAGVAIGQDGSSSWALQALLTSSDFQISDSTAAWPGTARLTILKSNGNVGINNTAPDTKFHVTGAIAAYNDSLVLDLRSVTSTTANFGSIRNGTGRLNFGVESSSAGGLFTGSLAYACAIWGSGAHAIQFAPNNTMAVTILSDGKFGIATTAPSTLLHVGLAGTTLGTIGVAGNTSGLVTIQPAAAAGTWTLTLPTSGGTANYYLKTNGSGVSSWAQLQASEVGAGAALTKTDDTNITLTLGGSPTTALLAATSLTLGWTGTLAASRGGTGRAVFTYTTTFGDASNASFTITHNLGSKDVCVTIYETASPYTEWYSFVVKKATTNTVTIDCGFIPGSGEFTVGIK